MCSDRVRKASVAARVSARGAIRTRILFKRCGCGKAYDRSAWYGLPYVGETADDVERLELRQCECGSTITINL